MDDHIDHLLSLGFVPSGAASEQSVTAACGAWTETLPRAYIQFLSAFGGGDFEPGVDCQLLAPPAHAESGTWSVDGFLDLGEGHSGLRGWLQSAAGEEVLSRGYFPCAEAPGGDLYCLELGAGSVGLWNHETGEIYPAAESFERFVLRLCPQPEVNHDLSKIKLTLDPDLLS